MRTTPINRWRYKVETLNGAELEGRLNKKGMEGWRVVNMVPVDYDKSLTRVTFEQQCMHHDPTKLGD